MTKISKNFSVPMYIVDELIFYIEETAKGHCKSMKWENIKALLRLAQVNKRLSSEQVVFIIETYCRE